MALSEEPHAGDSHSTGRRAVRSRRLCTFTRRETSDGVPACPPTTSVERRCETLFPELWTVFVSDGNVTDPDQCEPTPDARGDRQICTAPQSIKPALARLKTSGVGPHANDDHEPTDHQLSHHVAYAALAHLCTAHDVKRQRTRPLRRDATCRFDSRRRLCLISTPRRHTKGIEAHGHQLRFAG